MSARLEGKRILVTGASSGIGRALACRYASEGARLVVLARRRDRLEQLVDQIAAQGGEQASAVVCDLAVRGNAARAAEEILADGEIDVLVNNAGGAVGGSVWAVADGNEAREDFEVDFWSPLALIGAIVPGMRKRKAGTVINVTSMRQVFVWPSFGQNTAAQAALAMITETLRLELEPFGVKVVEVIPGPIETAAQGPTQLIPGLIDAVHARLGTATADELAKLVIEATVEHQDRVFCPTETGRKMYENPMTARADIAADARLMQSKLPSNELVDSLVIGADHPLIQTARKQWEDQHASK